jgi:hypothetical protein
MSERAKDLAERLKAFNDEVSAFVEGCDEQCWRKMSAEDWTVGVVARHIGAGHYGAAALAKMIVDAVKLPELTMEQINEMANQHARENAGCTKAEVLGILKNEGAALVGFAASLGDAELDRTGYFAAIGSAMSTQQFIEGVVLMSGAEHFANMKAAVRK